MNLQDTAEKRKAIIEFCAKAGQIIGQEAIGMLEKEEAWESILEGISEPIVRPEKVASLIAGRETKLVNVEREAVVTKGRQKGLAKDCDPDYRIMKEYDITGQSTSEGKVKDFLTYFRDKYDFLSSLLQHRQGFSPKSPEKLKGLKKYEQVDLAGMVIERWVSKAGNITIELETPESKFLAIVSKDDLALTREAERILVDDVVGIKGKKFTDEMVIVQSIIWPDMSQRPPKLSERDLSVCLVSDTHVGSKLFMEKEFTRFLSWINGDTASEKEAERLGKIKYLVVAGDNVDGVGVYPEQYDELAIRDIYAQYGKFCELIGQVPEHIEVFIIPGQHDAVRRADPQPAIPGEFVKGLEGRGNVHFVGSPSWVEIEGLKCLIYHGGSFHDMYAATKHLSVKEPQNAMIELLRRRDISTGFGLNQPYVPEKRDFMVIREEPDFYFGGDMHHKGYSHYRGCTVANAGCWQERTNFQIREGHVPTPGIALDISLKTRRITENNFKGEVGNA
ncbi:DNA polymerase II small subunit [uncultured archaeon]|nr:DNA polymerase II small subunit [uncultured archaeon]